MSVYQLAPYQLNRVTAGFPWVEVGAGIGAGLLVAGIVAAAVVVLPGLLATGAGIGIGMASSTAILASEGGIAISAEAADAALVGLSETEGTSLEALIDLNPYGEIEGAL